MSGVAARADAAARAAGPVRSAAGAGPAAAGPGSERSQAELEPRNATGLTRLLIRVKTSRIQR